MIRSGVPPSARLKLENCSAVSPPSKLVMPAFASVKLPAETSDGMPFHVSATTIRRAGSRKGSGRSTTASTALKIAVVPPMPSASVSDATRANPGWRRICRHANPMS